jgi:hypothetical protein
MNLHWPNGLTRSRDMQVFKDEKQNSVPLSCRYGHLKRNSCPQQLIHSVFCLTTGPKPPPKRFLHILRSRASSFIWEHPLLSLRSTSSSLHLQQLRCDLKGRKTKVNKPAYYIGRFLSQLHGARVTWREFKYVAFVGAARAALLKFVIKTFPLLTKHTAVSLCRFRPSKGPDHTSSWFTLIPPERLGQYLTTRHHRLLSYPFQSHN